MSYANVTEKFRPEPQFGHAWRDSGGIACATVQVGVYSWLSFDDPAHARAVADACIQAADAMEALPPAQDEVTP